VLSALRHRNFRRYFAAQIVANIGTWVQITVANWLVLQLSLAGWIGVSGALSISALVCAIVALAAGMVWRTKLRLCA